MPNSEQTEPLFSTTLPSQPRRQVPSVKHNHHLYRETDMASTASFRHADSTSRALAAIAQSKYDTMERRRAGFLLMFLVLFAGSIHLLSSNNHYFRDGEGAASTDAIMSLRYKDPIDYSGASAVVPDVGDEESQEGVQGEDEDDPEAEMLSSVTNLRDVSADFEDGDVPFFWHIPRCGGSTIKNIMGECFGLVSACEVGVREGHENDEDLDIIDYKGAKYVNVDTSNLEGIKRAKQMNLIGSTVARPEVVVSSYLLEIAQEIYDEDHKGKSFVLFRHPIERAVSMYHHHLNLGNIPDITLEDYAKGQGIENNWMVRYVTGRLEGDLPKEALEHAKVILKKKFLVGFLDDLQESMERFIKYNNWVFDEDADKANHQEQCVNMLIEVGSNRNVAGYDLPKKGSQAYSLISWQTQYDIKLYQYAKELFDIQTKTWGTKERKKADKKKKKLSGG